MSQKSKKNKGPKLDPSKVGTFEDAFRRKLKREAQEKKEKR